MKQKTFTEKYRAKKFSDFVGLDPVIADIKKFFSEFPRKKALLLHGSAGTGKTSLAIALANENNLEVMELNASDLRNKAKLESVLKPASEQLSLFKKGKILLMDEVDGVTGTDIGGIPELVRIIETSEFPIVMTCNDAWQSKLSPLRSVSKLVEIKPIPASIIFEILINVTKNENIKTDLSILQKIAIKSQGDVRAAMNDLQSYNSGGNILEHESERRDREDNIFAILRRLFKERDSFLELFDTSRLSLDEILLWIEENIPKEYKNEALAKAYYALGKADVFRGRIYRNQSWRFLIYQNIFQSAGISFAKKTTLAGFTKYEPPKRVLKIWMHNQKTAKKKTIAKKYASLVHCSTRRALNDFPLIAKIMQNPSIQKQIKLSEEEMSYLEN